MNAAIIFTGKYGNTRQYAQWISETTGFPVYDLQKESPDPRQYEVLILGSPVINGQLTIRKWVHANWGGIKEKSIIFFSVSTTVMEQTELQRYLEMSLPPGMFWQLDHVALTGEFPDAEPNWWSRLLLKLGLSAGKDPVGQTSESNPLDSSHRRSLRPLFALLGKYYDHTPQVRHEPPVEIVAGELELA